MNRIARPVRTTLRSGFVAVAFVATAGGCSPQSAEPHGSEKKAAQVVTIALVQPQRKSLCRVVEQPGTVEAFEQTQLFARVPGYVEKVHVDIGQKIEANQVLAEISVPELNEETKQKKALTRQAEAEVDQARKALAAAEANIATSEASVVEAKALFERWESESKRFAKMVESGTIDAQARDETKNQFKAAGARVLSTEAAVRKAKADRDKAGADVRYAEARVEVAKADALRSEAMLGYGKIRAPYQGVVTWRKVNTGDFVQPAAGKGDWLFSVAKLDTVRIVVSVPEADAGLVQEKAPVKLNILAAQSPVIEACVTRISWALEPSSRTLRAEIDLPNKQGRLRPGMYVSAQIINQCPESFTVPAPALAKQGDKSLCFMINQGKVVATPVLAGRTDGQFTEVSKWQKSGSPPTWQDFNGSESIAARALGLTDGQTVEVKPSDK